MDKVDLKKEFTDYTIAQEYNLSAKISMEIVCYLNDNNERTYGLRHTGFVKSKEDQDHERFLSERNARTSWGSKLSPRPISKHKDSSGNWIYSDLSDGYYPIPQNTLEPETGIFAKIATKLGF